LLFIKSLLAKGYRENILRQRAEVS